MSRSFVVAMRLALFLAAALAGIAAFAIAVGDGGGEVSGAHFACPMHPEVVSPKPGQCPICGMALEPSAQNHHSTSGAAMPGMADLTAVENVRRHKVLDFVRMHALPSELRELRGAASVEPDRTISAVFYTDQASAITPSDDATFTFTDQPDVVIAVRLSSAPAAAWDEATVRLRFEPKKGGVRQGPQHLTPGQAGWLEVPRKARSVLAVPASAILYSPKGPYVLRALASFRFEQRQIEIAETFTKQGFAVLLSGLQVQDRVVARAAFFLDADRRLENPAAAADWGAP